MAAPAISHDPTLAAQIRVDWILDRFS